jgi:glucosyl-3-phosphoglycerate phosphatase
VNHLPGSSSLKNRFYIMRHGQSLANLEGIIVSDPTRGIGDYGLSEAGRSQVERSVEAATFLDESVRVLCSDFRRARETAEIVHRMLTSTQPLQIDPRLRERYFGRLDLGPDTAYSEVWRSDERNPDSEPFGAESANRVMARVTSLICECEENFSRSSILLVSHGDALQILQTAFAGESAARHRRISHLETAEIRLL